MTVGSISRCMGRQCENIVWFSFSFVHSLKQSDNIKFSFFTCFCFCFLLFQFSHLLNGKHNLRIKRVSILVNIFLFVIALLLDYAFLKGVSAVGYINRINQFSCNSVFCSSIYNTKEIFFHSVISLVFSTWYQSLIHDLLIQWHQESNCEFI